jgi:hypothetical protein
LSTLVNEIWVRNKVLAFMGFAFLVIAIVLGVYALFNTTEVLGVNAMIKPIKFCISTWIYAWTMAHLLYYVHNQNSVWWYSILASVVMVYENGVITVQAFRGQLSHFNKSDVVSGILYAIMGILIVWLTTATLVIALRFIFQKTYSINTAFALSIKIGLVMFVIFSFLGGYMSIINSHNIGGNMGDSGLPFVNWSTVFGDVRVAHFFGIHSLQGIPLMGFWISNRYPETKNAKVMIWLVAVIYFLLVSYTFYQALQGMPFISI